MIYTISKNVQIYENYVNNQSFSVDFFFNKRLWAVGSEQRAVSSEQWAVNSEQWTESSEQRAESREQKAVNSEQGAVNREQLSGITDSYSVSLTRLYSQSPLYHLLTLPIT